MGGGGGGGMGEKNDPKAKRREYKRVNYYFHEYLLNKQFSSSLLLKCYNMIKRFA